VKGKGVKLENLSRPEKIYCDNTNLMHVLVPRTDVGVKKRLRVRKERAKK